MTTVRVGVVSPTGRVTPGPPAIHLAATSERTRCGRDITADWTVHPITHPRQTCRACKETR